MPAVRILTLTILLATAPTLLRGQAASDAIETCEELFQIGVEEFEVGNWPKARKHFEQARSIKLSVKEGFDVALDSRRVVPYHPGLYLGLTVCADELRPPKRRGTLFNLKPCQCAHEGEADGRGFRAAIEQWRSWRDVDPDLYRSGCRSVLGCEEECEQLVDAFEAARRPRSRTSSGQRPDGALTAAPELPAPEATSALFER